jgi:hypothetical protein
MTRRTRTLIYLVPLFSLASLMAIANATNPIDGGPGTILLVFVLLYVLFASVMFIFLHVGVRMLSRVWANRAVNVREWRIGVRRAYYIASVVAFGPVLLLAMQSVGQLQLRDVALVAVLISLGIFYVVKRS